MASGAEVFSYVHRQSALLLKFALHYGNQRMCAVYFDALSIIDVCIKGKPISLNKVEVDTSGVGILKVHAEMCESLFSLWNWRCIPGT